MLLEWILNWLISKLENVNVIVLKFWSIFLACYRLKKDETKKKHSKTDSL